MSSDRQTVVITGAGRGIGRVIATHFARTTGFNLVLLSRTLEHLQETARLCRSLGSPGVHVQAVDLTDPDQIEKISVPEEYSKIRALVNNAGQYQTDNPERINLDDLQYQVNHNAISTALVTRRFLPLIREQDQSLIVNICSVGSYKGLANSVGYAMGKHAVLGYTRSLREYLKGTNVAVTALSPGSTWSTSWEGSKANPDDTIDATDLAILIETLTRLSPRSVVEEMTVAPK